MRRRKPGKNEDDWKGSWNSVPEQLPSLGLSQILLTSWKPSLRLMFGYSSCVRFSTRKYVDHVKRIRSVLEFLLEMDSGGLGLKIIFNSVYLGSGRENGVLYLPDNTENIKEVQYNSP